MYRGGVEMGSRDWEAHFYYVPSCSVSTGEGWLSEKGDHTRMEEARKALIADDKAALEEVLEGLEDAETLKWIEIGMMIGRVCNEEGIAANMAQPDLDVNGSICLQHVQEQLQVQFDDMPDDVWAGKTSTKE